jgi:hypothetical protein
MSNGDDGSEKPSPSIIQEKKTANKNWYNHVATNGESQTFRIVADDPNRL